MSHNGYPPCAALKHARVLVTGGTGALGLGLVRALHTAGAQVTVLTRSPEQARKHFEGTAVQCLFGDVTIPRSLASAVDGVQLVFHLASHTPVAGAPNIYQAPEHWLVTAVGTQQLVEAAVSAGVKGFVYFSSVKAMGDAAGAGDQPADESTPMRPDTLYGRAKLEAERCVLAAGAAGPMRVCVLRLPMVYGLRAKGNLERMIAAVARGRFPPWPRLINRRSAVHADDVIAAALLVATDYRAAGKTYLLTDGEVYSTRWIFEQIHLALGRPVPRWTLPIWCWRVVAWLGSAAERVAGKAMPLTYEALGKLSGDAWYSSGQISHDLCFAPVHSLEDALPEMVAAYLSEQSCCPQATGTDAAMRSDAAVLRRSSSEP